MYESNSVRFLEVRTVLEYLLNVLSIDFQILILSTRYSMFSDWFLVVKVRIMGYRVGNTRINLISMRVSVYQSI